MPDQAKNMRRFRVHARHLESHHARVVVAVSFEAATVAYLDDFQLSAPVDEDNSIKIIVRDIDTGHEHCFTIDLASGVPASCG